MDIIPPGPPPGSPSRPPPAPPPPPPPPEPKLPDPPPRHHPKPPTSAKPRHGHSGQRRDSHRVSRSKPQPGAVGVTPGSKPVENHLNRETPFVAAIKFRNQLPDLPCDPKMLTRLLNTKELSKFHLTEMEKTLRPDISVCCDTSLSALHADKYDADEVPCELHPDDRALIEGTTGTRMQGNSSVSWLMKTRYMHKTSNPGVLQKPIAADKVQTLTLEDAKQQIEESFAASKLPPVHPSKPDLKPVSVMPVLPNVERYSNTYVAVSSSTDVVTHMLAEGSTPEDRAALYERCILRTYDMPDEDPRAGPSTCVALMLPDDAAAPQDQEFDPEGRYNWARDFTANMQESQDAGRSFVLTLSDKGALYLPIESHISLSKRKRTAAEDIPLPVYVDVQHRLGTEEEQARANQRVMALYGFEGNEDFN